MIITTHWNEAYQPIADLTVPRWEAYCAKYGHRFSGFFGAENGKPMTKFNTVRRSPLNEGALILWVDVDCIPLRMDVDIQAIMLANGTDYTTVADQYGLCNCIALIKWSHWTKAFIDALELLGKTRNSMKPEQDAMKTLRRVFPEIESHLGCVAGLVADPDVPNLDGAFVYHGWASAGVDRCVSEIKRRL